MHYSSLIKNHLQESARVKELVIKHCSDSIISAVKAIAKVIRSDGKILIAGNGGSAADAQHIAAEFVVRLSRDLERPALPALALTTDTSILTAGGNDIGFERVFARQVEALGSAGDIFLPISTSGNSNNIITAIQKARKKEMQIVALLGRDGGKCAPLADIAIIVPSINTQYIQEAHITIGHILVELVERTLFES